MSNQICPRFNIYSTKIHTLIEAEERVDEGEEEEGAAKGGHEGTHQEKPPGMEANGGT